MTLNEHPPKSAKSSKKRTGKKPAGKQITLNELRERLQNPETPIEDIRPYLKVDYANSRAFAPAVSFNESLVVSEGLEGDFAIGFFNWIARRRREFAYRKKIRSGYDGIRIVEEGDSWHQYPLLLDDVIDHLSNTYAVRSLSGAGHLLADMVAEDELTDAIIRERPDVFLLSGGGNDLLGGGKLKTLLHPFKRGLKPSEYPNRQFERMIKHLERQFSNVFDKLTTQFPSLKILCHGYDYAVPSSGPWLGDPMHDIGIVDEKLQKQIVAVLIDRVNDMQQRLADRYDAVHHVDCRGVVGDRFWEDELHPTDDGFGTVAARFKAVIEAVTSDREGLETEDETCPGAEVFLDNQTELPVEVRGRIAARRARMLAKVDIKSGHDEESCEALEQEISVHFEKIHLGADFLPAEFLTEGAKRARAVCRIVSPGSRGTGFLIASRRFLMTNHHVLPDKLTAEASFAEFGFEEGSDVTRIPLNPSSFFIKDEELDFAIVACDGERLNDVEAIPLLRNPATVALGERVNIIQHPEGRLKEIAIHDNKVEALKELVLHYRTDTQRGSSGAPVFNNTWDLVALHHAGVVQGRTAMNEGIRLAAIVSHLIERPRNESQGSAEGIAELIELIPDSSPLLGFFDLAGVEADSALEVEVPSHVGTGDFADIGFWNIENFNNGVSKQRVDRVADVLNRMNMDVMGLTEVQNEALDELRVAMADRGDAIDYVLEDTRGRQDIAIVYDKDTAEVSLAGDIAARHTEALNARTSSGRTAFPRKPLFARCKVTEGNLSSVDFVMIVVHLKAFGDAQSRARRRLAAKILAEIIEDIRNTERLPVVIGGDFNEKLNNDVLSSLSGAPDLFALTADDARTGAASYIGPRHRSLIDHIIVSRDIRPGEISGDDAAIVRLDRSVRDFADRVSDHVPVVMRLIMRTSPIDVDDIRGQGRGVEIDVPDGASSVLVGFEA